MQQIDKLRAKPPVYMLNLGIPFCCVCDQKESFPHCSIANNNAPKLNILKEFLGLLLFGPPLKILITSIIPFPFPLPLPLSLPLCPVFLFYVATENQGSKLHPCWTKLRQLYCCINKSTAPSHAGRTEPPSFVTFSPPLHLFSHFSGKIT